MFGGKSAATNRTHHQIQNLRRIERLQIALRQCHQASDLLAHSSEQFHFAAGMKMRLAMLHVDDAGYAIAHHDGADRNAS